MKIFVIFFSELAKIIVVLLRKISSCFILRFILILFIFTSNHSFSQSKKKEEWRLRKNENGIRVYTRRPEGAAVDELRVISVMHASLSSIVAVMMDVNHYSDWIYACAQSTILQQTSTTEQYQYQVIDVPTPFTDRDAVIHFKVWQDPKTKIVYTKSEAAPAFIAEKKEMVRVQLFNASYQLIPQGNGDVKVIYSLRTDPGGYVPDWLVNWTIVTGPYQSTLKMQDMVKKPEYAQTKLSFIEEQ